MKNPDPTTKEVKHSKKPEFTCGNQNQKGVCPRAMKTCNQGMKIYGTSSPSWPWSTETTKEIKAS